MMARRVRQDGADGAGGDGSRLSAIESRRRQLQGLAYFMIVALAVMVVLALVSAHEVLGEATQRTLAWAWQTYFFRVLFLGFVLSVVLYVAAKEREHRLENRRLHEELVHARQALEHDVELMGFAAQVAEILASPGEAERLHDAVEQALDRSLAFYGAAGGAVVRPNAEPDRPIETVVSVGPGATVAEMTAESVAVKLAVRVARTGGPYLFTGQQDEDKAFLAGAGVISAIGIPLRVGRRLHSVLCLWTDDRGEAFGVSDVSTFRILAHQLEMALARAELLTEKETLVDGTLRAFTEMVESRTPSRRGHGDGVASLAAVVARALDLPEGQIQEIRTAGLLHDVGMAWLPDDLARADLSQLDGTERWAYEQHPVRGSQVVSRFGLGRTAFDAVLTHHERFDGQGYPRGLKGKEIPLAGRILGVADAFDAALSPERRNGGLSPHEAVSHIRGLEGSAFDPVVVDALVRAAHEAAVDPVDGEVGAPTPSTNGVGGIVGSSGSPRHAPRLEHRPRAAG